MANWNVAYGPHSTGPEFVLDMPDLTMTFYRSGQAHELTGTVDATTAAAAALEKQVCDVWAWRDGDLIFRGPIVGLTDNLGTSSPLGDGHQVAIVAHSYRERFANLFVQMRGYPHGPLLVGPFTPAADSGPGIGWQLLNQWIPITDLNGIVFNGWPGGAPNITPTPTFQPGQDVASTVDTVTQMQPFDWDLVPTTQTRIEYQAWRPNRGAIRPDIVIGLDGSAVGITRDDGPLFANELWLTPGSDGSTSGGNFEAYILVDTAGQEGRWVQVQDGSDTPNAQLAARASNLLGDAENPHPAYTFTMAPDWWQGLDHLWLGDQPTCVIRSGRLDVTAALTVEQIALNFSDGTEQISITAGGHPRGKYGEFAAARSRQQIARRFRAIEWRQ